MRIPVFARRANPSVDRPILRKSETYVAEQLAAGRVQWVDMTDPRKGVICREMLYFGERQTLVETVQVSVDSGYIFGIKFIPPPMEKNPTFTRLFDQTNAQAAPGWDWSHEPVEMAS